MNVTLPSFVAQRRMVHGESIKAPCPGCDKGNARMYSGAKGLEDQNGCWFCDDCESGGRYELVSTTQKQWKYRLWAARVH